jgi:hypothetical protein
VLRSDGGIRRVVHADCNYPFYIANFTGETAQGLPPPPPPLFLGSPRRA